MTQRLEKLVRRPHRVSAVAELSGHATRSVSVVLRRHDAEPLRRSVISGISFNGLRQFSRVALAALDFRIGMYDSLCELGRDV